MPHRPLIAQSPPRPVVLTALALLAGLALGFNSPFDLRSTCFVLYTLAFILLLAAGGSLWRSRRIHGPRPGRGLALLLALALLSWAHAARIASIDRAALAAVAPFAAEPLLCVEGTLAAEPRVAPDGVTLVLADPVLAPLRVGALPARLPLAVAVAVVDRAAATLNARPQALPLPGQRVRAWGRLRQVLPPTTPNPFDPEQSALSKGIGARLTVARPADLELGPPPTGLRPGFYSALRSLRRSLIATLEDRLPVAHLPMARALLLGDAHLVPLPERDAYTLTGLAHLLAVSGLNTAFVLILIVLATRLAGLSPRGSAWVGVFGVLAYAALTGFEPPVVRAAVMGVFFLTGYLLKRVTTPLASLATAALATLIFDPRNLTRVDWQLSYACVLSIVLLMPPINDLLSRLFKHAQAEGESPASHGWWRYIARQYFLVPLAGLIAVHLGLFPLQVCYFRQYNLLSPLYNMLCGALSLFVMFSVGVTGLLGAIPGLGWLAALPALAGLAALARLVTAMAAVPHVTLTLVPLSVPLAAIYYGILLGGSWLRGGEGSDLRLSRRQVYGCMLSLGGMVALVAWAQLLTAPAADGRTLDLYLIDVGQGDCTVVRSPGGKVMVIDAGPLQGKSDRGRWTVGPFLKTLGVSTIDCLIATHADADHIGGIPFLLEHFRIGLLLEGPDTNDSELYRTLRRIAQSRRIASQQAHQGDTLAGFAPVQIRLLGPAPGQADNNASLAMLLDYHDVEILLTGDLEAGGERQLLAQGLLDDVEILKLGHHGSRSSTSEDLLAAVQPEAALISVGRDNRYGHPSGDVLQRLASRRISAFRTDRQGTLWLRTDGRRITIYRYASR